MRYRLGEICEIVRGGSPRPIMNFVTDSSDGVNWLKIGDVNEFDKYFIKSAERIIKEGALHSREVKKGDLILSNSMSFGRPFITLIDGYIHDGWLRVRNDPDLVDREYLYYFLSSDIAQNQFQAVATGSVVNNLKSETVKAVVIDLPPLPKQREIATTLSVLDEKITVNRHINHHLEQMAQAIFKSWFVDFEPFANGEFVESELGEIPDDWRVGTLSELVSVKYGKDHKKLADGSIPVFGSGGIMRFADTALYNGESVLIPRKGTLNNVIYVNQPFWSVDTMFFTEMNRPNLAKFVYFFVRSRDLVSMNAGSAVPSMTTEILNALQVVIPPDEELARFEDLVDIQFQQIQKNQAESAMLATLRDALLPRLMSGELSLKNH